MTGPQETMNEEFRETWRVLYKQMQSEVNISEKNTSSIHNGYNT